MTRYVCSGDKLTALGDAIREKTKTTDTMTLDEMATAVSNISTGVDLPDGEVLYCTITNFYDKTSSSSLLYSIIGSTLKFIILPNLTAMPGYICKGLTQLTTADLPVCTSIGTYAFSGCTSLTEVNLPVCTSIETYAFSGCTSLTEVNLPVCTSIGTYAFQNCSKLATIDLPACTSIGSYAFAGCTSLATELNLPDCTVSYRSFQNCPLTYIDVKKASASSFDGLLDSISIEDLYITLRMTSITAAFFAMGAESFNYSGTTYYYINYSIFGDTYSSPTTKLHISLPDCTELPSFTGAFSIYGPGVFNACTSLVEVNLPVCTSIGVKAFYGCTSLAEVNLPVCTSIGDKAFSGCTSLTEVNLPVCTSIGTYAFQDCLAGRTNDLHITLDLKSVTKYRFYVGSGSSYYTYSVFGLQYTSELNNFSLRIDLPACTSIDDHAFDQCIGLTEVNLPVCTSIGTYAFYTCTSLVEVNLPACTSIGTYAFYTCTSLVEVNLPACTSIGTYAFQNCSKLATIDLPACTSIDDHAFDQCIGLTEVNLPVCTSIGTYAFYGCTSLTEVNLPACTSIGTYAFQDCLAGRTNDLHITLDLKSVTKYRFYVGSGSAYYIYSVFGLQYTSELNNFSLRIDLPACTSIDDHAFDQCIGLTEVNLPVCTSIGTYAFYGCTSLVEVNLPVCTSIGTYAFYICTSLVEVNLPVCTSIGTYAFQNCSKLATIDLPVCTSIGTYAFQNCSKLTTIILRSDTLCTIAKKATVFDGCTALTSIFVPDTLVDSYKAATNWSSYANYIKPLSDINNPF